MAKRKAREDIDGDENVVQLGNTYTAEQAQGFVQNYERLDEDEAAIKRKAVKDSQWCRDDKKQLRKDASEAGLPKKVFAAMLRERKLERQKLAVPYSLNDDQKDDLEILRDKLGELANTPLGQAALQA